jgi:hypothetical protein
MCEMPELFANNSVYGNDDRNPSAYFQADVAISDRILRMNDIRLQSIQGSLEKTAVMSIEGQVVEPCMGGKVHCRRRPLVLLLHPRGTTHKGNDVGLDVVERPETLHQVEEGCLDATKKAAGVERIGSDERDSHYAAELSLVGRPRDPLGLTQIE